MSVRAGSLHALYLTIHRLLFHELGCALCHQHRYAECQEWWAIRRDLVRDHDAVAETLDP